MRIPFATAWCRVSTALLIAAAAALPAAAAAASMKPPSCEALDAWAGTIDWHDTYEVAPRVALPKALAEPQFSAIFGLPALSWTPADIQAAKQAADDCYREARKRRDRAAQKRLGAAGSTIARGLPKVLGSLEKAKESAVAAKQAIDALPDSAALDQGLEVLLAADPAAPDTNPLSHLPPEVGKAVFALARTLPALAEDERAPIFKALTERRAAIGAGLTRGAEKAIAAAPDDSAGILALLTQRQDLAELPDADARTRLEQQIDRRVRQIRDGLRQAKPPVWVPPACVDLYRWAGQPGANQGVKLGRTVTVWRMLSDEHAMPVFGISLADWTDDDLAQFGKLQDYCRAEVRALSRQKPKGTLTADETALVEAAAHTGWIDDRERGSLFSSTRTALRGYREAVATLQAAEAKIAALPDANESIALLEAMRDQPALGKVGEKEFNRFQETFNAKLRAIGAHAAEAAIKGLAEVKVAQLGDLAKLRDYANQVGPSIPVPSGQNQFRAAYERAVAEAAKKLLPRFQAKLDAMPEGPEGIKQVRTSVAHLTGLDDRGGRLAGLQPLRAAMEKRTDAIIHAMRQKACDGLLSELGAESDAEQPLWDGRQGIALGAWICGLAAQGATVSGYSGAGMFSSTSTLEVTMPRGTLETYSLHEAEVKPGKKMLVGFAMKDANQETKLSVDQWAGFAGGAEAGVIMDTGGCRRFAETPPDEVAAIDKPYWLQCGLQLSGLGKRGR
jgi:hypothetical protein